MSRCARSWWSGAVEAALRVSAAACVVGPQGRTGEPQAGASSVSGGRVDDPEEEAETLRPCGQPLLARTAANQEWALDFLHDAVECGRAIRVLSVVDAYTRECLALEVDTSFASRRVTRVLDAIVAERGQPKAIRCDNGPELTSRHFLAWCVERQIELVHIQPGKPTQNAHVESFHGRLREECLTVSWFQNLFDARRKIAAWKIEYNEERPHSSLGIPHAERVCGGAGSELPHS